METKEFKFNEHVVEFELDNKRVMVNATQMAKIFDKDLFQFTKSDHAKGFIESCQKPAFAGLLGIEKEEDLIISRQKSGTFMHRILALKFAAWLNPDFEVWIYSTIDDILFASYKEDEESLKKIAKIQNEISEKEEILAKHPDIEKIEELKREKKKEERQFELRKKNRISGFRTFFSDEDMNG